MCIDGNYAGNSIFSIGISENNIDFINKEIETNLLLKIKYLNKNIYEIQITFDNKLFQNITSIMKSRKSVKLLIVYMLLLTLYKRL